MTRSYSQLSEIQELEPDTSLVKTYLIEAHVSETAPQGDAATVAERVFTGEHPPIRNDIQLVAGDEEGLLTIKTLYRRERITIYLDHSNPRFWVLHSTNSSTALDTILGRLVKTSPELDRVWFPADLLERATDLGDFRGLSLSYDRGAIEDIDFDAPDAPVEMLKMQLWGRKAGDVLQLLRRERGGFPRETSLAKVKIKYWIDDEGAFALDDIKYNGKVTTRGTSFDGHIELISTIYRSYQAEIRKLESHYALRRGDGNGSFLEGSPIDFVLNQPINDVGVFCDKVFSATWPFRLWGVPVKVAPDFFRVRAVDLHVGNKLHFEIADEFIRVYLPAQTCGNSIFRFYTNLQHFYDARVTALNSDGEKVFAF